LPVFFFSSRRRHTRFSRDWSSDVCSSDLPERRPVPRQPDELLQRLDGLASIPLFQPDQQFLPTARRPAPRSGLAEHPVADHPVKRSEEHTSELQSRENLVCRLLLEKKNHIHHTRRIPY